MSNEKIRAKIEAVACEDGHGTLSMEGTLDDLCGMLVGIICDMGNDGPPSALEISRMVTHGIMGEMQKNGEDPMAEMLADIVENFGLKDETLQN